MQVSSYRASIPGSAIADLYGRLALTRWPDPPVDYKLNTTPTPTPT